MTKTIPSPIVHFLKEQQVFSLATIRLVGYGLLAMALIDFLSLLIPPQLMNPIWEFQTLGLITERIPLVLLGLAFIFCGEREERTFIEHKILKWISWFSFIFAIFLFLSFPLSLVNGFRIFYSQNALVNARIGNNLEIIDKFNSELQSADSLEEIATVLQQQSKNPVRIPHSIDKEQLKQDILKSLSQNKQQLKSGAKRTIQSKKKTLLKNALKWNLGSLISAFILFFIWKQTHWARTINKIDVEEE